MIALLLILAAVPSTERLAFEYTLSAGADLAASEWALHQHPRAFEIHPFGSTTGRRAALKLVQVGGLTFISHKLKRNHPKWEKALRWTAHGVQFGLAGWAIRQGRRKP